MVLCFQCKQRDGGGIYTQLAFKADSRRCGQWTVLVQNPVGGGKRKQRGCWNGKHKLSWGKTVDTGLENEEQRREGCKEHMVQLCAGEGQGAVRNRERGGTGLCMVSFQG